LRLSPFFPNRTFRKKTVQGLFEMLGRPFLALVEGFGRIAVLFFSAMAWAFRPPFRLRLLVKQLEFVGVRSFWVVVITGAFTGMVIALQTYYGFRMFSAESLVGGILALSVTRELGPVITALVVAGRAGSAIAAELGTMRVTQQIDALASMAVDPVQYLVTPRILAGIVMLPLLVVMADFVGYVGGYFVGVKLLGINSGMFMAKTLELMEMSDLMNGLVKAAVFGLILTTVGCYKGYYTSGGAEGVGRATTDAVVISSLAILISDYFLTAVMF